jgi:hypothetical protein
MRDMNMGKVAAVASFGLLALGVIGTVAAGNVGSAETSWPSVDSAIFDGLPRDVVSEVLANPQAQDNVQIWPADATEQRNALWQGMVINFVQCRQLLGIYQAWEVSSSAPELPPVTLPANPVGSVVKDASVVDSFYRSEIASGDIARLRADLTNESGCGAWIPVKPGDSSGPTIASLVGGNAT